MIDLAAQLFITGMLDIKGRAKYDAWKAVAGLSNDDAMQKYVSLVDDLLAKG